MGRPDRLLDIIVDPDGTWARSWIRVCAVYAIGKLYHEQSSTEFAAAVEVTLGSKDSSLRESALWTLHRLAPERSQIHAAQLVEDPDPQVARLAAELSR